MVGRKNNQNGSEMVGVVLSKLVLTVYTAEKEMVEKTRIAAICFDSSRSLITFGGKCFWIPSSFICPSVRKEYDKPRNTSAINRYRDNSSAPVKGMLKTDLRKICTREMIMIMNRSMELTSPSVFLFFHLFILLNFLKFIDIVLPLGEI
jgi:hypothetical protein